MKLRTTLLVVASLLLPATALADQPPDELRYDFLDIGVNFGEIDSPGGDVDFSSIGIAGSWGFHENFALFAGLSTGEIDTAGDIDTTELAFGINPHFSVANNVDLIFPIAIRFVDLDAGIVSDDDTGYSIGFGVRALLSPAWELGAVIQHVDIFGGDEQSIAGNVRWHINHLFSAGLGLSASDDATSVLLDVRFSF